MNTAPAMPKITPSDLKKTISFHVSNLDAADAVFLNSIISTFCDPNKNLEAEALRTGLAFLAYGKNGKMIVLHRLDADSPSLSRN